MRNIFLGLALLSSLFCFGQKHDFIWMLGYEGGLGDEDFGISILDFNSDTTLSISTNSEIRYGFDSANTVMSDKNGNFLFASNGSYILDASHYFMKGGENLNASENHGYILPQGVLALPHPRDSNLYAFFHGRKGYGVRMTQTWYSEIDMRANEGLGEVILMDSLISDTLLYGQITAVQHGNGRDWWILFQRYCLEREGCTGNFFYRVLLTPDGVRTLRQPIIRSPQTDTGLGQAVFTPDGTKYIAPQADNFDEPLLIDIYDFDRCTGWLSNKKQINATTNVRGENGGSGLAISPNSRYIYLITWMTIFQFDLWADDIEASKTIVAEYDGFVDVFPTRFLRAQLAPDGKIYIATTNSSRYLHVIHHPNRKGVACEVEQHGIRLPTFNGFSIPNYPNYRLGKWENSPCDTLPDVMVSVVEEVVTTDFNFFPNPTSGYLELK
ncbi:MAG: hypothetical protein AAGI23_14970, partial [Bacteroidota bacterium]